MVCELARLGQISLFYMSIACLLLVNVQLFVYGGGQRVARASRTVQSIQVFTRFQQRIKWSPVLQLGN